MFAQCHWGETVGAVEQGVCGDICDMAQNMLPQGDCLLQDGKALQEPRTGATGLLLVRAPLPLSPTHKKEFVVWFVFYAHLHAMVHHAPPVGGVKPMC